jgi:hypothetical protein
MAPRTRAVQQQFLMLAVQDGITTPHFCLDVRAATDIRRVHSYWEDESPAYEPLFVTIEGVCWHYMVIGLGEDHVNRFM